MTIDSGQWPRLSALLDQALELAPEARPEWFASLQLQPGEADRLRRLLAAVDGGPEWLDRAGPAQQVEMVEGDSVGPFRVTGVLGRGGMGVVYAAVRQTDDLPQQAALKLLPASFDSAHRRERFLEERRLLARLEHPGIARLIDAGVTKADQPWFAMERVLGESIDEHCQARGLDLRMRLHLMLEVFAAVQYAHGQLIVHRDLKPSNILVDQEGRPRLLDFGIAKALDDPQQTGTIWRALTPAYAAPEQIRGEPPTVVSDVWSLGVLMYLLLVGRTPFAEIREASGPAAELGAVLDRDPLLPSRAAARNPAPPVSARELRGDLDAIVMRALARDPAHRYGSVEALAADVRRHLAYQPVHARRGVLSYRIGRFLRRYRLPVAVTAAALLALTAMLVYALAQADRARDQAQRAQTVTDFLIEAFEASAPQRAAGSAVSARDILEAGARRIESGLLEAPTVRLQMLGVIGRLYVSLALYSEAARLQEIRLEEARVLYGDRHLEYADALLDRGSVHVWMSELEAGKSAYETALAICEVQDRDGDCHLDAMRQLAKIASEQGEADAAEHGLREVLARTQRRFGPSARQTAEVLDSMAEFLNREGRYQEAEQAIRQALAIAAEDPQTAPANLVTMRWRLAVILRNLGRAEESIALMVDVVDLQRRIYVDRHPRLADAINELAMALLMLNRPEEAEPLMRESVEIYEAVFGDDTEMVATVRLNLGTLLWRLGKADEATELLKIAEQSYRSILGDQHQYVAMAQMMRGRMALEAGDMVVAEPLIRAAVESYEAALSMDNPLVANARQELAKLLLAQENASEAEPIQRAVLANWQAHFGDHDHRVAAAQLLLAKILLAQGKDARELLSAAATTYETTYGVDNSGAQEARALLDASRQ